MTYSSMDPQHRMIFCALECACSSYKPAIFMDSGFLVEAALEVLGGGGQSLFGGSDAEESFGL